MRSYSTATAPWVDEDIAAAHEVEQIRGRLWNSWREVNSAMENRLSANPNSEVLISDLHDVGRTLMVIYAANGDADAVNVISAQMQDLLQLRKGLAEQV